MIPGNRPFFARRAGAATRTLPTSPGIALASLILATVLSGCRWTDLGLSPDRLQAMVTDQIGSRIGRPVTVKAVQARMDGTLVIQGLTIMEPAASRPELTVTTLEIALDATQLFQPLAVIRSIKVVEPVGQIVLPARSRESKGAKRPARKSAGAARPVVPAGKQSSGAAPAGAIPAWGFLLSARRMELSSGTLAVVDPDAGRTLRIEGLAVSLTSTPARIDLDVSLTRVTQSIMEIAPSPKSGKSREPPSESPVARPAKVLAEGIHSRLRLEGESIFLEDTRLRLKGNPDRDLMLETARGHIKDGRLEVEPTKIRIGSASLDLVNGRASLRPPEWSLELTGGLGPALEIVGGEKLAWIKRPGRAHGDVKGHIGYRAGKSESSLVVTRVTFDSGTPTSDSARITSIDRVETDGGLVEVEGLALTVRGEHYSVDGTLRPRNSRLVIENAWVRLPEKRTLELTGSLATAPPNEVDLTARSDGLDLSTLAPKAGVSGTVPVDIRVTGPSRNPRIVARAPLKGIRIQERPGLPRLACRSGEARLDGKDIHLERARVEGEGLDLTLDGTVVRALTSPEFDGLGMKGRFSPRGAESGLPSGRTIQVSGALYGSLQDPLFRGKVSLASLPLGGSGGVTIQDIFGTVGFSRKELAVQSFKGRIGKGSIRGSLNHPAGGPLTYTCSVSGIPVASFLKNRGTEAPVTAGTVSLTWDGRGRSLAEASGHGTLWVTGLILDGARFPAVRKAAREIERGQLTGGILGALLGDKGLGALGQVFGSQAQRYADLVRELARQHSMGGSRANLRLSGGVVTSNPIAGDRVNGQGSLDLRNNLVNLALGDLWLSRVHFKDVHLVGPSGSPAVSFSLDQARISREAPALGRTGKPGELDRSVEGEPVEIPLPTIRATDSRELLDIFRKDGGEKADPGAGPEVRRPSTKRKASRSNGRRGRGQSILEGIEED